PRGPAKLFTGETLSSVIEEQPIEILGDRVAEAFSARLPFLFKILSVKSALSIQAHPDISLAEKLHELDPANYPDTNHKPEIAVALTDLTMLCGFRPIEQIVSHLDSNQEIRGLLSDKTKRSLNSLP